MLDTFNAVWTALTTTNEELIKVLLIPCNFIEITITMLLSTTLLKIEATKKQKIIYNQYTDYCADMNILLSYYHCLDDKLDDGSIRGYAGTLFYDKVHKQTKRLYKRQARKISVCLKKLNELEKDKDTKIFDAADCFGWLLAEIMCFKKGYFEKEVKKFGFHLGRFVYIMDAFDDIRDDIAKNRFNPLKKMYFLCGDTDVFNKKVYEILISEMSEACAEFEKLPCVGYIDILRNILYAGVWNKYDKIINKEARLNSCFYFFNSSIITL